MARRGRHKRKQVEAPKPSQRVTIAVDEIGAQGEGVAMLGDKRIYAPLTAPGDIAVVDLTGDHGVLVELQQESPYRTQPPCRHYGACGGCSLQHVNEEFQHDWKRQRIISALTRVGLIDPADSEIVSETAVTPAASRRRATFSVRRSRGAILLGFNMRRSNEIVELEDCRVLHPDLLARLDGLRDLSRRIDGQAFDMAVTLCENGLDIEITGRAVTEPVGAALENLIAAARAVGVVRVSINGGLTAMLTPPLVRFDGVSVTPPHGAFLQASLEGEAALTKLVTRACVGARKIADLFAGCGTFALPLARQASVFAVDNAADAIGALGDGVGRAQRDGVAINPVRTAVRDLFERPLSAAELKGFDAVVFDPPRAGAAAQAAEIARCNAPVVVAVSCNPATFARDARSLADGGYTLTQATPVDQFVYSAHVEVVGVFRKD